MFNDRNVTTGARNTERKNRPRVTLRLTKRFAEAIDGISLAGYRVGDVIDFPPDEARVLIASEWAVLAEPEISNVVDAPSRPIAERSIADPDDLLTKHTAAVHDQLDHLLARLERDR
jgi:hypothetical protein